MILNVVTPHGARFVDLEVKAVTLPGVMGEMQILPGHEALLAALDIGIMRIEPVEGAEIIAAVSGGYVEVIGDTCHCLVETCETPDEIDLEKARSKEEEVSKLLEETDPLSEEYQARLKSLRKAQVRQQVGRMKQVD